MELKKDYIIIQCKTCDEDIAVRKYDLTRKNPHSGLCRKCAMKKRSIDMINKTDRDIIYLRKQLRNIKSRCSGKYKQYDSYYKKGIKICDEWLVNPDSFIEWAKENGWNRELTIDRKDNDGNYEPSNCRWISNKMNVLLSEVSRKSRGASNYIGVWFRKDTQKWAVEIKVDTKKISLGCFDTELEGAKVREQYIKDNGLIHLKLNFS